MIQRNMMQRSEIYQAQANEIQSTMKWLGNVQYIEHGTLSCAKLVLPTCSCCIYSIPLPGLSPSAVRGRSSGRLERVDHASLSSILSSQPRSLAGFLANGIKGILGRTLLDRKPHFHSIHAKDVLKIPCQVPHVLGW